MSFVLARDKIFRKRDPAAASPAVNPQSKSGGEVRERTIIQKSLETDAATDEDFSEIMDKQDFEVFSLTGQFKKGFCNGEPRSALLHGPTIGCFAPDGSVIFTEIGNIGLRIALPDGTVLPFAGNHVWARPKGLWAVADGILVADSGHNKIKKVSFDGESVVTIAGSGRKGLQDGSARSAQFDTPTGICTDSSGRIFVADTGNNVIRMIETNNTIVTLAGDGIPGNIDGDAAAARFNGPTSVVFDERTQLVIVSDAGNHSLRAISPIADEVQTVGGSSTGVPGFRDGPAHMSLFHSPSQLAVAPWGDILVADRNNNCIRQLSQQLTYISTLIGSEEGQWGKNDGPNAKFNGPRGVACHNGLAGGDSGGEIKKWEICILDTDNHTLRLAHVRAEIKIEKEVSPKKIFLKDSGAKNRDTSFSQRGEITSTKNLNRSEISVRNSSGSDSDDVPRRPVRGLDPLPPPKKNEKNNLPPPRPSRRKYSDTESDDSYNSSEIEEDRKERGERHAENISLVAAHSAGISVVEKQKFERLLSPGPPRPPAAPPSFLVEISSDEIPTENLDPNPPPSPPKLTPKNAGKVLKRPANLGKPLGGVKLENSKGTILLSLQAQVFESSTDGEGLADWRYVSACSVVLVYHPRKKLHSIILRQSDGKIFLDKNIAADFSVEVQDTPCWVTLGFEKILFGLRFSSESDAERFSSACLRLTQNKSSLRKKSIQNRSPSPPPFPPRARNLQDHPGQKQTSQKTDVYNSQNIQNLANTAPAKPPPKIKGQYSASVEIQTKHAGGGAAANSPPAAPRASFFKSKSVSFFDAASPPHGHGEIFPISPIAGGKSHSDHSVFIGYEDLDLGGIAGAVGDEEEFALLSLIEDAHARLILTEIASAGRANSGRESATVSTARISKWFSFLAIHIKKLQNSVSELSEELKKKASGTGVDMAKYEQSVCRAAREINSNYLTAPVSASPQAPTWNLVVNGHPFFVEKFSDKNMRPLAGDNAIWRIKSHNRPADAFTDPRLSFLENKIFSQKVRGGGGASVGDMLIGKIRSCGSRACGDFSVDNIPPPIDESSLSTTKNEYSNFPADETTDADAESASVDEKMDFGSAWIQSDIPSRARRLLAFDVFELSKIQNVSFYYHALSTHLAPESMLTEWQVADENGVAAFRDESGRFIVQSGAKLWVRVCLWGFSFNEIQVSLAGETVHTPGGVQKDLERKSTFVMFRIQAPTIPLPQDNLAVLSPVRPLGGANLLGLPAYDIDTEFSLSGQIENTPMSGLRVAVQGPLTIKLSVDAGGQSLALRVEHLRDHLRNRLAYLHPQFHPTALLSYRCAAKALVVD